MRALGLLLSVVGAFAFGAVRPAAAQEAAYVVVVNVASPIKSISRPELSRLFLKRETQWATGETAVPVDLGEKSTSRSAFSKDVHHKSVGAVKAFWQQQIFSGRETPPVEKESEDELLQVVRTTPAAVGYVSAGRDPGPGVRILPLSN